MNEGVSTGQLPFLRSPFEKRMFFDVVLLAVSVIELLHKGMGNPRQVFMLLVVKKIYLFTVFVGLAPIDGK